MTKAFKLHTLAAAVTAAALSQSAFAIEAAAMKVGEVAAFTPTLSITETYNDNWTEVETNEQDSWITSIAPSFTLARQDRLNTYSLSWNINQELYSDASGANNLDHTLAANAHLEFSSRSRLDLNLGYSSIEDNAVSAPEDYTTKDAGFLYGYGNSSAQMQLEFGAKTQAKRYDQGYDGKEVDTDTLTAAAYYRVAPATRAVLEYRHSNFDYVSDKTLDSSADTYLLGVVWDATAKTTGSAKIGYSEKDFDDASRKDTDGTTWEVGVTWMPRTYSSVSLNTSQSYAEGSSDENYIDTTITSLNWNHAWSSMMNSNLYYTLMTEDYEGRINNGRSDDTTTLGASVTYNLKRWVDLNVGVSRKELDSPAAGESYDANIFQVGVVIGL